MGWAWRAVGQAALWTLRGNGAEGARGCRRGTVVLVCGVCAACVRRVAWEEAAAFWCIEAGRQVGR